MSSSNRSVFGRSAADAPPDTRCSPGAATPPRDGLRGCRGQQLRIVRADGIHEVLHVVASLVVRPTSPPVVPESLLVLLADRSLVGLPAAAGLVDPEPPLGAVEDDADPHAAFVVGVLAAGAELEEGAVDVFVERGLRIRRFLR